MIRHTITPDTIAEASQRFAEHYAAQEMWQAAAESQHAARPSPSRLYAYAAGTLSWPQADIDTALRTSLSVKRTFRHMLATATAHHLPQARAASSDALPQREGRNCRLTLEPSRAEPDQIYLIVELQGQAPEGPVHLVLCSPEEDFLRLDLPAPRGGIAQLILNRDSDVIRWLSDPRTEAFIQ